MSKIDFGASQEHWETLILIPTRKDILRSWEGYGDQQQLLMFNGRIDFLVTVSECISIWLCLCFSWSHNSCIKWRDPFFRCLFIQSTPHPLSIRLAGLHHVTSGLNPGCVAVAGCWPPSFNCWLEDSSLWMLSEFEWGWGEGGDRWGAAEGDRDVWGMYYGIMKCISTHGDSERMKVRKKNRNGGRHTSRKRRGLCWLLQTV